MSSQTLDPRTVAERIGADGPATYVDVRTVAEFCRGRPKGRAVNVPWLFHYPNGDEHPNAAFELVMCHHFEPASPLVVGGDDGPRTAAAAAALTA
ncbi:MAG: hypothetical protein ACU85V_19455, partial [Gammaproteobacteria bacterium]